MSAIPFLQPARGAEETREIYVERRRAGQQFVRSILAGVVFWNTQVQRRNSFKETRIRHPETGKRKIGKGLMRQLKLARRLQREGQAAISVMTTETA
jgi:hypothetical protein